VGIIVIRRFVQLSGNISITGAKNPQGNAIRRAILNSLKIFRIKKNKTGEKRIIFLLSYCLTNLNLNIVDSTKSLQNSKINLASPDWDAPWIKKFAYRS
jgi:hypothetical protein